MAACYRSAIILRKLFYIFMGRKQKEAQKEIVECVWNWISWKNNAIKSSKLTTHERNFLFILEAVFRELKKSPKTLRIFFFYILAAEKGVTLHTGFHCYCVEGEYSLRLC